MTSKDLEKMVGYLVYAAWVEPFGRPFISALSSAMVLNDPNRVIARTEYMSMAINIWILIFGANRGVSFHYILNKLPWAKNEWFVDASSSWGIGGCCGEHYFMLLNGMLLDFLEFIQKK